MWRSEIKPVLSHGSVLSLKAVGEDLPFLKDKLTWLGVVLYTFKFSRHLEFKPSLHRNTLEKNKSNRKPTLVSQAWKAACLSDYWLLKDRPLASGALPVALSPYFVGRNILGWWRFSSQGWESNDIYPSSKELSLLKTKTKSPDEQNVLYSDKPTQCLWAPSWCSCGTEQHHSWSAHHRSADQSDLCLITAELDPATHISVRAYSEFAHVRSLFPELRLCWGEAQTSLSKR